MAGPLVKDRVKETSTTTGTGTYTLLGAVAGFQSFSVVGNANTCFYCAEDGTNWECGIGTYTLSGTTLARTTILFSSNANAAVDWAAGTRNIFVADVSEYTSPIVKVATTHALHVANETALSSTLGNARGTGAVDWQTKRTAATQVASGNYSTISGGLKNTASGAKSTVGGGTGGLATASYSTIGGGYSNDATNTYATVGGGLQNNATNASATVSGGAQNTASGAKSTVCGGGTNTASGSNSTVSGNQNTASASYSTIPGGLFSKADKYGQQAYASGNFSAQGDAQTSLLVLRGVTTDATPTELYLDGAGATARMTLANNTSWGFNVNIIARKTNVIGTDSYWVYEGGIRRGANAAATALFGTVTLIGIAVQDAGAVTWVVTITADTTNGSLKITVTGVAATTIQWVATVNTVETTG